MKKLSTNFDRLSFNHKIITLIVIEIVVLCVITWVAFIQVKTVGNEVRYVNQVTFPLVESIRSIETDIDNLNRNAEIISANINQSGKISLNNPLHQLVFTAYLNDFKSVSNDFKLFESLIRPSSLESSDQLNIISIYAKELLVKLSKLEETVKNHHLSILRLTSKIEVESDLVDKPNETDLVHLETQIFENLSTLLTEFEQMKNAVTTHSIYVERIAIGFIVLTSIAASIFFISMLLLIVRKNISKPLQLLTDTINAFTALHKVEESEFEKGLMVRGDELGRLSRSFNRLKYDLWSQGRDLSDAKEEAEKANRAKSEFLAAASHDLRQPLHAMQMYIAVLRQKNNDAETIKIIENIDAVSVSTARLLSALLDVSQLEAGAIKPQFQDFLIQDVLNGIYRSFFPTAKQKSLDFRLMPTKVSVNSDPVLLERILGNFMSNAVRYTQKGRVLIGCRRRGKHISIEVWDTGCGIPDSEALAIFEDFHQIHNVERDRSKGLGLGLGIAQRLSVCLGHEIECNSIVGSGSRFAVLVAAGNPLPIKDAKVNLLEHTPWNLSGVRVLLIEDDKEVLEATQQLLISWGCKVNFGRNLDDVLRIFEKPDVLLPDMIIADYRLPDGANGMEVATRAQLVIGHAVPIIVITGDVGQNHIRDIADQGYRVLTKPVQPAKLRALISHLTNPSD